ncbi:MAG: hypothetical protein NW214_10110 [Pseudanabaenaceae cyanobacterium bins.39]|nr:hypothetical protein [Pseudanabaenaceae cyanobacterium bins.39]
MRQFPIILIPPEIQRIAQSKPAIPEFTTKIPQAPLPPSSIDVKKTLYLTGALILFVAVVALMAKELAIIILLLGTVAIIVQVRYQFTTYKTRYQSYQEAFQRYLLVLENYSREDLKYQQEVAIALAPERVRGFRQQQLQKFWASLTVKLAPSDRGLPIAEAAKISPTLEEPIYQFGCQLQKAVTGIVYQGTKLHISSLSLDLSPALVYVEPNLPIPIAIEVVKDEQSSSKLTQDNLSDRFLNNAGWIIIKFSQAQIWRLPETCCEEVIKLLEKIGLQ